MVTSRARPSSTSDRGKTNNVVTVVSTIIIDDDGATPDSKRHKEGLTFATQSLHKLTAHSDDGKLT